MSDNIAISEYRRFVDDRGTFNNYACPFIPKRAYTCYNHEKGIVRGFHYHKKEEKYFVCLRGAIKIAVAPLLLPDSLDIVKMNTIILSAETTNALYVPAGYANGWQTLQDDTLLLGMSSLTMEESVYDDHRIDPLQVPDMWKTKWR